MRAAGAAIRHCTCVGMGVRMWRDVRVAMRAFCAAVPASALPRGSFWLHCPTAALCRIPRWSRGVWAWARAKRARCAGDTWTASMGRAGASAPQVVRLDPCFQPRTAGHVQQGGGVLWGVLRGTAWASPATSAGREGAPVAAILPQALCCGAFRPEQHSW